MKKIIAFLTSHDILILTVIASVMSIAAILYFFSQDQIILYGDAESHLNISKRVVSSITPGLAQLGGIWLPLPHLLMTPFVYFDFLWRTGLAGAIISGISFVVTAVYLYKFAFVITKKRLAGVFAFLFFATNGNALYMQSTPMTEILLVAFFTLSSYYMYVYLINRQNTLALLHAAFFGFAATLTRYDGWFLVIIEAGVIAFLYLRERKERKRLEGQIILFCTLGFFGIGLWLLWNFLILGNPLYFTDSPFSAKSQQQNWLARGELPTYHNLLLSFEYYGATVFANIGVIATALSTLGIILYGFHRKIKEKFLLLLVLLTPLIFYVVTLFIGQSVIFIPSVTPSSFEWNLFNVRYGLMMVPVAALFISVLALIKRVGWLFLFLGLIASIIYPLYMKEIPITLADGVYGLSSAKVPDAQHWMSRNYTEGIVLIDDYARTMSVARSPIAMEDIIYIGNKPYWEESMDAPEKYASWIIMQKDDALWRNIYDRPEVQGRLFKYFKKVYTSPQILIFQRNQEVGL